MEISSPLIGLGLLMLAAAGALGAVWARRAASPLSTGLAVFSDCVIEIAADGRIQSIEAPRSELAAWYAGARRWTDLVHPDDHDALREALARPAPAGFVLDARLRAAQGDWQAGLLVGQPARSGKSVAATLYFRSHAAGFGSAPAFGLAPFITAVTHQLNNRLHLIRGFAELSIQRGDDSLADASGLARINEVVDESAELLRRLSTLATERPAAPRPLDLGEELSRIVSFAAPILGGRIVIRLEPLAEPLMTFVPPLPLQQALSALLILAAGNQGRRGEILLSAERDGPDRVALEILAGGMDPEAKDASSEEASSLALAIERLGICGGRLDVETAEGSQRFRIVLPGETAIATGTTPGAGGRGRNILVVDASPSERARICDILEEEGYRTWEAGNGSEAQAMAESLDTLALLIVDLLLDSETGIAVRDRILARRDGTRVLFTTAFPGVLGFAVDEGEPPMALAKPYKREELIERVRGALEG